MTLTLMESRKATEGEVKRIRMMQEDFDWMMEHSEQIWKKYKGKYIAIVNKEVFVGNSRSEAKQKAKKKYPRDNVFIRYIPYKMKVRVI